MTTSPTLQHAIAQRRIRIFSLLKEAAERRAPCPKNYQLAVRLGCGIATVSAAIADLETAGLIKVERGNSSRVVTICASGARTAGTIREQHWRRRRSAGGAG
jgi:DNA-binding MarR family transcriptional regulator